MPGSTALVRGKVAAFLNFHGLETARGVDNTCGKPALEMKVLKPLFGGGRGR